MSTQQYHSKFIGYVLWIFGFMGAHRFYYSRPSGTIYFFTLGVVFLIGWIIDLFLIPRWTAVRMPLSKRGTPSHPRLDPVNLFRCFRGSDSILVNG